MTAAILSFATPVAPQAAPAPAPAPQTSQGFARMLSQRQAMAHETAPQHGAGTPDEAQTETHAPKAERQQASTQRADERATKADKPKPAQPQGKPAHAEATTTKEANAEDKQEPVDPVIADWLAALNLPGQPVPTERATGKGKLGAEQGEGGGTDAAGDQAQRIGERDAGGGQGKDAAADALQAAREARDRAGQATAVTNDSSRSEWQAALEQATAPVESRAKPELPGVNHLTAAAPAHAPRSEATVAPAVVNVPTPATAPDFSQALGVQVSVLARDGIQQAELHLNPADMGPISVQIALEGTQAQVNFGADLATTRQIIENGLPELAAALRDAGFTLSGGGVDSHARGRDESGSSRGDEGSSARGGASTETEVTPRRTQARVSAGGVDVYA